METRKQIGGVKHEIGFYSAATEAGAAAATAATHKVAAARLIKCLFRLVLIDFLSRKNASG